VALHERLKCPPDERSGLKKGIREKGMREKGMRELFLAEDRILKRNQGFSLIEMLTVLAIGAVLISLIFPAISTIKGKANNARCLSNLKSIGSGVASYLADNGFYPMDQGPLDSDPNVPFQQVISPYVVSDYRTQKLNDSLQRGVFGCPEEKDISDPYYTYGLNIDFNYRIQGPSAQRRIGTLAYPASYVLISDSFHKSTISPSTAANLKSYGVDRRHNGHPNFLYADGHASSFTGKLAGYADGSPRETYLKMWVWNAQSPN
jgi:prepilin-type N-terminal cleavage/methylation domain-containing protein/prepilin-type processing-associated H-X9-DG protein